MRLRMRRIILSMLALSLGADMAFAESNKADKPVAKTTTTTTGGFDINALDKTANPCVDFYQFACGGWCTAHPLPGDKSRYGRFDELQERNRAVLHDILEGVSNPKAKRNPVETKVGDFYAACMDEKTVETKGAAPLQPFLKTIKDIQSREDLFKTVGKFNGEGLPGIFGFG